MAFVRMTLGLEFRGCSQELLGTGLLVLRKAQSKVEVGLENIRLRRDRLAIRRNGFLRSCPARCRRSPDRTKPDSSRAAPILLSSGEVRQTRSPCFRSPPRPATTQAAAMDPARSRDGDGPFCCWRLVRTGKWWRLRASRPASAGAAYLCPLEPDVPFPLRSAARYFPV